MYDTILVPLDGSKRAEAILPHVREVAGGTHSKVILLTALQQMITSNPTRVISQDLIGEDQQRYKSSEDYLNGLAEELRRMDIRTECKVVYGQAVEKIIQVAEEEQAGLIAIASHGRTGLARVFYGSIAAGVLQAIDRPLLLIRSRNE